MDPSPFYLFPLAVSAVVSGALGGVLWRRSEGGLRSADRSVALVQAALFLWSAGQILLLAATPLGLKLAGLYVTEVGAAAIGPAWLLFALAYTGNDHALSTAQWLALLAVSAVGVGVAVTNDPLGFHDLYFTNPTYATAGSDAALVYGSGPLRWAFAAYCLSFSAAGNYYLYRKFVASRNVYRTRTFLLLAADVVVVVATVVGLSPFSPTPHLTLAPMLYAAFAVLWAGVFLGSRTLADLPVDSLLARFRPTSKTLAPMARDVVMEEMESGVVVVDHENRIVDVNPLGRRLLAAAGDRIVGKRLAGVADTSVYRSEATFLDASVTDGCFRGVWVESTPGQSHCFDVSVSPLTDDTGETCGRVLMVHDVTDREQRKQKLEARTTQLRQHNERLEDFAAIVSHDLRNPLNVAHGAVDLAEERGDPEYFEKLRWSHERMEAIIDDVLTLARQGRTIEETEPVPLTAAANDAWRNVETDGATLSVRGDVTVDADRSRLVQVFENLFRNSVEHGGPGVTVTVGPFENGFYVEDDGPGISEDRRGEVLDRGFTTSDTGTGLGLSIVRTVVEAHGWEVTVAAGTTGGARFEMTGTTTGRASNPTHGTA